MRIPSKKFIIGISFLVAALLACGGGYYVQLNYNRTILTGFHKGYGALFDDTKKPEGDSFYTKKSAKTLTLEADWEDLQLAMPELNPAILLKYKELRSRMVTSDIKKYSFEEGEPPLELKVLDQLTDEFRLYVLGAAAYKKGDIEKASEYWLEVLALPKDARHYRSVWASWMMARLSDDESRDWYEYTETLVEDGFRDSLNIVENIEGWQAYEYYKAGAFVEALLIYQAQGKTGKLRALSAAEEINWVISEIPNDEFESFMHLAAAEPQLHELVSLCFHGDGFVDFYAKTEKIKEMEADSYQLFIKWVELLELNRNEQTDTYLGLMAEVAYNRSWDQCLEFIFSKIKEEGHSCLHIRAKLAAKERQFDVACSYYEKIINGFSSKGSDVEFSQYDPINRNSNKIGIYEEYAAIKLYQKKYIPALVSYEKGGYHQEAAYVAESLLSVEELLVAVRNHYSDAVHVEQQHWLRVLLARKLARNQYFKDAKEYMPEKYEEDFDHYVKLYRESHDSSKPRIERARLRFQLFLKHQSQGRAIFWYPNGVRPYDRRLAAGLSDRNGDQIPDKYNFSPFPEMTTDEIGRFKANYKKMAAPVYRYEAAEIAYEAALLLPKNDPRAAYILWKAGSSLMFADPEYADKFYKALVRRCGQTALGKLADEKRWFPQCQITMDWETSVVTIGE